MKNKENKKYVIFFIIKNIPCYVTRKGFILLYLMMDLFIFLFFLLVYIGFCIQTLQMYLWL